MAENKINVEYNLDENIDCGCYKNEDRRDNESIAPDSDWHSSHIEVSSVGSSEVSSDHTNFEAEWDDNGPNNVNDATVTANANIPNWTNNFTEITFEHFSQDSGSSLPEDFDVSVPTALDYFNLLLKPEIFSDIRDNINNYAIFKQGLTDY